ncbi:MAG: class I SAM-dependent methyltransferase [Anaerolineae bacterium]|nr:class I SAM-dependent methyltransferase [Anaerolineae bacterium]
MSEISLQDLRGVAETLLIPLYVRALESQRPDALMKDEKAVALVTRMSHDFDRIRQIPINAFQKVMRIMLTREMDRYARAFLSRHPEAVVVHIGCGLDSRFERVDNGRVEWFDLDLPDVVDLRRSVIGDERERYHLLGCSVLDSAWLEAVQAHPQRPLLFLAETVFVYFTEAQVKALVLTLRDRFSGAELVFDGWSPLLVWVGNRHFSGSYSKFAGLLHWGVWRGRRLESWGDGIRLLDEWGFFDRPEPRLARIRWLRHLKFLTQRIYHFQLGKAA